LGARLVRLTLALVDDPQTQQDLVGLSRLAGARSLGQLVPIQVLDRIVGLLGVPDARLRVGLVASQLLGLAAARTVVKIEPLASMPAEEIVEVMGPMLQRLLDPTSPTVRA
ncbi:MAG: TetR/AcrR family transcriptional regulator, partial [Actinomycetales bacterium]